MEYRNLECCVFYYFYLYTCKLCQCTFYFNSLRLAYLNLIRSLLNFCLLITGRFYLFYAHDLCITVLWLPVPHVGVRRRTQTTTHASICFPYHPPLINSHKGVRLWSSLSLTCQVCKYISLFSRYFLITALSVCVLKFVRLHLYLELNFLGSCW